MPVRMIAGRTAESVALTNRVAIEVHTASFRAVRGYTLVAAVLDERPSGAATTRRTRTPRLL